MIKRKTMSIKTRPFQPRKQILITGCRGIPARYGGFETFAEKLALFLVKNDYDVTVYCQVERNESTRHMVTETWKGVRLVKIPVHMKGPIGTVVFDWYSIRHAMKEKGTVLTLGYNTALFNALLKFRKISNIINLGGIEWHRDKWSWYGRLWLWINEWMAPRVADKIIADHPEIKKHILARGASERRTFMIPYGAEAIKNADPALIEKMDLKPDQYALVIARPEPENSILEIVRAFSAKNRGVKLVVLGALDDTHAYHRKIREAAGPDVVLAGGIYNKPLVASLRQHCRVYIHGHKVGGTNPSLVEALGAGNPVIAHDNRFNRWVAGNAAVYFKDEVSLSGLLQSLLFDQQKLENMRHTARMRHQEKFIWDHILTSYADIL